MRLILLSTTLSLIFIGCGSSSASNHGAGGGGGAPGTNRVEDFRVTLTHSFDPQSLGVGEESWDVCQSWVLDNDEPLYVRKIRQTNDGGWHHSNWFFVPEALYKPNYDVESPDASVEGTWNCSDRNFSEYLAAAAGGVFFAQSTQTLTELQAFPNGAALVIPPRSVIVGSTHLLNIAANRLETAMTMEVETVPRDEVNVQLTPISFQISRLNIPPAVDGIPTESRTSIECDLTDVFRTLLQTDNVDYSVYYVLGHYHDWGNYFNLSFVHGDGTRDTIFEIKNSIGEPIGSIIDPPMHNDGATKLRSECGFINDTDETLRRGLSEGEMCDFIAYTDANVKIGTGGSTNNPMGENEEGMPVFEVDCPSSGIIGLPGPGADF